ncbi:MAG: vitamin K-dependent gamma-carboxylase [Flavobacteriales bacterium]|jgi:hypothetical protein
MKLDRFLFTQIDNSPLIVFRIFFGLLITLEAWGAIATGWVRKTLVAPEFTFNFIGFDFLQTFPGPGAQMYGYFALMGIFGVFVMLGYKYRWSMLAYGIMWAGVYFMQKSSYNNHYYLLMLLCGLMTLLPAGRAMSLDAMRRPEIGKTHMSRWVVVVIVLQLWIVYTYASVAKLYPDWLDATVPESLMKGKKDYWFIGDILQQRWVHYAIAYVGILFDGLIIPLLLWKKTRKWAFGISIFFHLFNSIVFQIGIFPYMSLAFSLFFFEPKVVYGIFLKRWKAYYDGNEIVAHSLKRAWVVVLCTYFIIQIGLPVRHWIFPGDVLWTEEGHRLSWRMMLRSKSGSLIFYAEDRATCKRERIKLSTYLSKKQQRNIRTKPDMIWQFAQRMKNKYAAEGRDMAIYANCRVRVNGRKLQKFTDETVDLTSIPWNYFGHSSWVLESGDYLVK